MKKLLALLLAASLALGGLSALTLAVDTPAAPSSTVSSATLLNPDGSVATTEAEIAAAKNLLAEKAAAEQAAAEKAAAEKAAAEKAAAEKAAAEKAAAEKAAAEKAAAEQAAAEKAAAEQAAAEKAAAEQAAAEKAAAEQAAAEKAAAEQAAANLLATPRAAGPYAITFNAAPTGGTVTVTASGSPIASGGTVADGTSITITVTASTGYEISTIQIGNDSFMNLPLSSWTGPVKIESDTTITVVFKSTATYTLTIPTIDPAQGAISVTRGGTTLSGSDSIAADDELIITATPTATYQLTSLTVNDASFNSGNIHTVAGNVTVAAVFAPKTYTVTYVADSADGTIAVTKTDGGASVATGSAVDVGTGITVVVTPKAGRTLTGLKFNETAIPGFSSTTTAYTTTHTVNGNVAITPTFAKTSRTVKTNITGSGTVTITKQANDESVASGATVDDGTSIKISAAPDADYKLSALKVNGNVITVPETPANPFLVENYEVKEDITVYATFISTISERTLDFAASEAGGSIAVTQRKPDGTTKVLSTGATVAVGDKLTVVVSPASGRRLTALAVGEKNTTGLNSRETYTMTYEVTSATPATLAIRPTFDAISGTTGKVTQPLGVYDEDGDRLQDNNGNYFNMDSVARDGYVELDGVSPNQTIYLKLGSASWDQLTKLSDGDGALASQLVDTDYFKLSQDKDGDGKSIIKSITQVTKRLDNDSSRNHYLKIELKSNTTTDELKADFELKFKAKKTVNGWHSGDYATLRLKIWINNRKVSGTDGDADIGDSVYFSPEDNDMNVMIWGDDRAALEFEADDDADDFYARLSTKTKVDIYTDYGDPVDADLWFYDFIGHPTVPATSRAWLTLGIPWDWDDDDGVDPRDCYIYLMDSDGTLTDITSQFTYQEDDREIKGWTTRTRTLGTYIVSDTALDLGTYDYDVDYLETDTTTSEPLVEKVNPATGGSDYYYAPVAPTVTPAVNHANLAPSADSASSSAPEKEKEIEQTLQEKPVPSVEPHNTAAPEEKADGIPLWLAICVTLLVLGAAGGAGYLVYRGLRRY